uniref:Uncharacterized protein n=1 Tax=Desulfovibrio sp. U5L TaxID=596152 RepID=I2PZC0_9BACT
MNINEERRHPGQGDGAKNNATSTSFMPCAAPVVNTSSPKLWRVFRKFNRNFKRIGRLQEENAALLREMHRLQGDV